MRPKLLVITFMVVLLSIHTHEAQGRRLRKGGDLPQGQQNKNTLQEIKRTMNDGIVKAMAGEDESKLSSGRFRKLITKPPLTPTTIPKNVEESKSEDNKKKEENLSTKTEKRQIPDVIDLAGMDYSLARRKPPIHN